MLNHAALIAAGLAWPAVLPHHPAVPPGTGEEGGPRVQVWTEGGTAPYGAGDRVHVFIRGDDDAYVVVLRVDTDGGIHALFPREPWIDSYVRGGRSYEIEQARGANAFDVDDRPGVGYLFAVSSPDPFAFGAFTVGDRWDFRAAGDGRIHGDPYVALSALAGRMVPPGDQDWDYDIAPYYVGRHYDYPRFLCYGCHALAAAGTWDPYAAACPRYRIVAHDDPAYYAYHYYHGAGVVIARPLRPAPRFEFTDRDGARDGPFVTVERSRAASTPIPREAPEREGHGVEAPAKGAQQGPRRAVPPKPSPGRPELRRRKPGR